MIRPPDILIFIAALVLLAGPLPLRAEEAPNLEDLERRIEEAKRQQTKEEAARTEAARKAAARAETERRAKAEADRQAARVAREAELQNVSSELSRAKTELSGLNSEFNASMHKCEQLQKEVEDNLRCFAMAAAGDQKNYAAATKSCDEKYPVDLRSFEACSAEQSKQSKILIEKMDRVSSHVKELESRQRDLNRE